MRELIGILLVFVFLIPGCGGTSDEPLSQQLPALLTSKRPEVSSAPPLTPPPSPAVRREPPYDPTGKPDPFQPAALEPTLGEAFRGRKKMPLEQFDVHEFQLVGILSGPRGTKAMVQDSSGKGYIIEIGTPIGKNQGRVVAITDNQVLVEENSKDFLGRKKAKVVTLKIPQKP